MATIEEKVQSVKSGGAATNPYTHYQTELNEIITAAQAITLVNNGDPTEPEIPEIPDPPPDPPEPIPVSDFVAIENEWFNWLLAGGSIQMTINDIMSGCNSHYASFWNHANLNYKNRPALLNGVHQIRINVAIEDAGGDALSEAEQEIIAEAQHNDLTNGTISFQPDSYDIIQTHIDSAIAIVENISNPIVAVLPIDVTNAKNELLTVMSNLSTISGILDGWYSTEQNQHVDSLAYATSYGAVMFAEQKAGDPVVESLMGNLP